MPLLLLFILSSKNILAEETCNKTFANLKNSYQLALGGATRKLDPKSYKIFEDIRLNPDKNLSTEETQHLESSGLLSLWEKYKQSSNFVRNINHWRAVKKRSQPITRARDHWGRASLDFINFWFATGLPLAPTEKAKRIFAKALRNADFSLNESERIFLEKWKLLSDFERYQEEIKLHKKPFLFLTSLREHGNQLRWGIIGASAATIALTPELTGEKMSFAEDESDRINSKKQGTLQFYFSHTSEFPPVIRFEKSAFVFQYGKVDLLTGEKLEEFEKSFKKDASYNRIIFRSSAEERTRLKNELLEYITRRRKIENGEELSRRMYIDMPFGEAYKLLKNHLHLPPAPIIRESTDFMSTYLGLQNALESKENGRIKRMIRVNSINNEKTSEMTERTFSSYVNTLMITNPAGATTLGGGLLWLDHLPNTRFEKNISIPPVK